MASTKPRTKIAALALLSTLILGACSSGDPTPEAGTIAGDGEGSAATMTEAPGNPEAGRVAVAGDAALEVALTEGPIIESRLIREAALQLRIEPGTFDERWEAVRHVAAQLGGYVGDASTGVDERDDTQYAYGTATVRVPAERFDDALDRFGELGERLAQSMSGTDVTEEYVDLDARLRHWRSVEEFTLDLLDQATTIDEAILVQQRLNEIQLTVEQLEGRIRYLDARTDMATVTVSLTEAPADVALMVEPDPEPGPIAQAVDQAVEVLLGTVGFLIVAAAFLLPLSLVALALALVYRVARRTGDPRSDPS
jgi:hypothetical protein